MKPTSKVVKNVLIVDDEKLFIKSIADGLKSYEKKHRFKMLSAPNGKEALKLFKAYDIALLITDLRMPEMDGITLISHVHNQYPTVPIIVMTAFGSPQIEKQIKKMGILHYLEKPIGFDEMRDHILHELSQKKKSRIEGVTLASFLQLIWMEKMTCTLLVKSKENSGTLSVLSGDLKNAKTETLDGLDAAMEILDWENVAIELDENYTPDGEPIKISIEELLMESFKRKDERNMEPSIEYESINDPDKINIYKESKEEVNMNIPKLNKAIESLKESLGAALLSTDIYSSDDAQSVAGMNSNPMACAIFSQFTAMINKSLLESKFPEIGRYYILDLVDKKMVVVIPMGDFQWGILIDGTKTQLGLLLNLAIPKAIGAFEEALAE